MNNKYFYPNSNVHVNKANIEDRAELRTYTAIQFGLAMLKLQKNPPTINKSRDLLMLHKVLFDKVFFWAGEIRNINITKSLFLLYKDRVQFSDYRNIDQELNQVDETYINLPWEIYEKDQFIEHLSNFIAELWVIHPLVEGNTRTIVVYLDLFIRKYGYSIDIDHFNTTADDIRNAFVWSYLGEFLHLKDILNTIIKKT